MRPSFADQVADLSGATRYDIDLDVDLVENRFRGRAQVRYTNQENEPLSQIVFRLLPNTPGFGGALDVPSIAVNGKPVMPHYELASSALYVPLGTPLAPGESIDIRLDFEGTLPTDDSAGYAQYGLFDGVLALPSFYPLIPVYDDEGWNVELGPTHGDATFTDTSLYTLRVTLPADMVFSVSGVVLGTEAHDDGTATYTVASGPVRDLGLVASAAYQTQTATVDDIVVTSYYLPHAEGGAEGGARALDYAVHALRAYQELIGPYPFAELDVAATPTKAGGIEYPGLIVVADSLYGEVGGFFEFATVHEVAHQWWYSLVGSDQLDEPWLDEALTQYTSLLYFEWRYGESAAQAILDRYFYGMYRGLEPDEQEMAVGQPAAAFSSELYGPIVYGKGPLFFHEMRLLVGDDVFLEILRTYFEQYRYGIAYPEDLLAVAERVSGQDLHPLYEEWILGAPD